MTKNKDILLITVDTLRYDFGGVKNKIIDKLRNSSLYFENAYSHSSWTSPAFKSLFSSRYPLSLNGVLDISKFRTLPSILSENGYDTYAIFYGPNDFVGEYFNYHRIFRHYTVYDPYEHGFINKYIRKRAKMLAYTIRDYFPTAFYAYLLFNALSVPSDDKNAFYSIYTNMMKNTKKPKFVWVHLMDVHEPYYPTDVHKKNLMEKIKIWSKNVPMVPHGKNKGHGKNLPIYKKIDELFGLLVENISDTKLKDLSKEEVVSWLKMWYRERVNLVFEKIRDIVEIFENHCDDFIIIITADHGQEFMEHNYLGHCLHLYNELIKIPLIIYGYDEKGIFRRSVSHGDILPTILGILSIKYQKNNYIGKNIFGGIDKKVIISENSETKKEDIHRIFNERKMIWEKRKVAILYDFWKYIIDYSSGHEELYNLKEDLHEQHNIVLSQPSTLEDLRLIAKYHMMKLEKERRITNIKIKI